MRVNIQQRIAKQLQELEAEFRKGHKSYVAKIKGQAIEEYRPDLSLSSKPTGAGGASSFFEEPDEAACDPRFNAQQTLQLVMMDQMSAEREKQINQVAESVNDLADIFKEIQVLVIDQGTVLDRIDYNIEQAASKVNRSPASNSRASRGCAHVSPPLARCGQRSNPGHAWGACLRAARGLSRVGCESACGRLATPRWSCARRTTTRRSRRRCCASICCCCCAD